MSSILASNQETAPILTVRSFTALIDMPLSQLAGRSAVFLAALCNLVNITFGEVADSIDLDLQVLVKLGIVGLTGCYAVWRLATDMRVTRLLFTGPMLFFSLATLGYFLASFTSLTPVYSLVSSGSAVVLVVAVSALMLEIGVSSVARLLMLAVVFYVAGSWGMYFFVPSQGVFLEPVAGGDFFSRMGGLAHPNSLGQISGFAIVFLLFSETRGFRQKNPLFYWLALLASGTALVMCFSRTAMAALVISLVWGSRHEIRRRARQAPPLLLATLCMAGLAIFALIAFSDNFSERITRQFSKSGDTEELTSLTGRSAIWEKTLQLTNERPLTGYGAATSKYLLNEYSLYTHNMFLNVALSAGYVTAALLLIAIAWGGLQALGKRQVAGDILLLMIVLNGLTENVIFSFLASVPTATITLALAWRAAESLSIHKSPAGTG